MEAGTVLLVGTNEKLIVENTLTLLKDEDKFLKCQNYIIHTGWTSE